MRYYTEGKWDFAANVVFSDMVAELWNEIDARHLEALATDEVLMTGLGPNRFDEFGKKALFGRCFMFMDAQKPEAARIERKDAQHGRSPDAASWHTLRHALHRDPEVRVQRDA